MNRTMDFSPVTLRGRWVELAPLSTAHARDFVACADPSCFVYGADEPATHDLPGFSAYIARALASGRIPLAMIDRATGRAVGTTSFCDVHREHRGVEIGFTWIAAPFRGTRINPEAKLLMLAHAFDDHHALRVQLKCDARNQRSQRAIAGIGATREGVLRAHRVLPDGFVRDTVMFSIIAPEWPAVRARLESRLMEATGA